MNQNLSQQIVELSALLQQSQDYWRPKAFHDPHLPWMDKHPALVQRLLALPQIRIEQLATQATALSDFLAKDLPIATELSAFSALPLLPRRAIPQVSPHFYRGIPGRKWQQVVAFAQCLPLSNSSVLEWCAGKSHLGFLLNHCSGSTITALEWNANLVAQANTRAAVAQIQLQSHKVDVLSSAARDFFQPPARAVALHACGELHERLLQLCVEQQVQQLHLAPCCYHKRRLDTYRPLSDRGREHDLALDKSDLHTAVMETATAGAAGQRQRRRLQIMRLGFDCLQRELRANNCFLPLPSLPAKWARASFDAFGQHCAQLKHIRLPPTVDWDHYWQLGEQRFWQVSALDLVRFLFRRPLEVWLALDRAVMLQEQGYAVALGTFCPAEITPRNLLLQAQLSTTASP